MTDSMESWLHHAKVNHKDPELKLSITRIMVGMMMVDEHLDACEFDEIIFFLTQGFDLSAKASRALVEQVQGADRDEAVIDKAAEYIIGASSAEERAYILSIVWRIALVDNEVSPLEEQYLKRLADLFEVPADRLNALKLEQERDFPNLSQGNRYQEF